MPNLQIRSLHLGEGRAKICVPLIARTHDALLSEAKACLALEPDLIEWRADYFNTLSDPPSVLQTARALRGVLAQTPLIFTVRSNVEGGESTLSVVEVFGLLQQVAETGCVDLIDLEHRVAESFPNEALVLRDSLVSGSSPTGLILSYHDFGSTPPLDAMIDLLDRMALHPVSAEILKLAVMPTTAADVMTLLTATHMASQRLPDRVLVTMSMGCLGLVSRICGDMAGSAMTFAAGVGSSAPGQVSVARLRALKEELSCPG